MTNSSGGFGILNWMNVHVEGESCPAENCSHWIVSLKCKTLLKPIWHLGSISSKRKISVKSSVSFYAFGIGLPKSCAKDVDEIDTWVDFTKPLCTQIPKAQKRVRAWLYFFLIWRSALIKAVHKMLVKSTLDVLYIFTSLFTRLHPTRPTGLIRPDKQSKIIN